MFHGWTFHYVNFAATPSAGQIALSWTNPGDADFAGTMVRFKTTGYPTGPTDGTQIYTGTGTSYTHTNLSPSTTYYYSAFAYDEVPNYATKADVSATTPAGMSWQVMYEGDVLPSAASPSWAFAGSESWASIVSGAVRVNDNSTATGSYVTWRQGWVASNATGTTVETRMRCASITYNSAQKNVELLDGTKSVGFLLYTNKIEVIGGSSYNLTGSTYHTYRFTLQGNTFNVYLDGGSTPILTGAPGTSATNQVKFGVAAYAGMQDIYFDYLYYTVAGAYPP
ncbi:MAG: fibronectin type III domain-containing protein [Armatimonadota bacterium]|nr:fibronectin type III domain-containing protein [Armatimonadota bacterium]